MPQHVGERLLDHAVRRRVDQRRDRAPVGAALPATRAGRRFGSARRARAAVRAWPRARAVPRRCPRREGRRPSACSSCSASRLVVRIASSARRASSGRVSMTWAAAPDWTAITDRLCAVTSCSSRAMRSRSSSTRAAPPRRASARPPGRAARPRRRRRAGSVVASPTAAATAISEPVRMSWESQKRHSTLGRDAPSEDGAGDRRRLHEALRARRTSRPCRRRRSRR